MSNVLILGANGGIARLAIDMFLRETDARLTLYLRNARRLRNVDPRRARVVEGDVLDTMKLKEAMAGQDVVYANLAGGSSQPGVEQALMSRGRIPPGPAPGAAP